MILSITLLYLNPLNRVFFRIIGQIIPMFLIYSVLYLSILKRGKTIVVYEYWKYSIKYNFPLIPHYLSQQILGQSDRIMIQNICGAYYAAFYSLAYQVSMVLNIITSAIDYSFSPWAYRKIRDKEFQELGYIVFIISLFMGLICITFSLFAPEIIYILGGKDYYSAIWIIPPVSMSVLFIMLYSLISTITFYYEKTKLIMFTSCCVAIFNLLLNYIFVRSYGFIAAGYTTLICYMIYFMIHYIIMKFICKKYIYFCPFNTKSIILLCMFFVVLSLFCNVLYMNAVLRYTTGLILIIIIVSVGFRHKNFIQRIWKIGKL